MARTEFPAEQASMVLEQIAGETLEMAQAAIRQMGEEMVEFLQAKCGVINPRPYKDSSKDGEYPKKRSGEFVDGLSMSFDEGKSEMTLYSQTSDHRGVFLQRGIRDGTTRPYATKLLEEDWGKRWVEILQGMSQE